MRPDPAAWLALSLGLAGCASSPALPAQRAAATATSVAGARSPAPAGADLPVEAPQSRDLLDIERNLADMLAGRGSSKRRARIAPEAFDPGALPVITIPEPLAQTAAPFESGGPEASEIVLDWKSSSRPAGAQTFDASTPVTSIRVSLSGQRLGKIRIGYAEGTISSGGAGGVFVSCGGLPSPRQRMVPARWETLEPGEKGGAVFTVVNAWFDLRSCKAWLVKRALVTAVPLSGGLLYAFRQRSGSPEMEAIGLVGPRFAHLVSTAVGGDSTTTTSAFTWLSLPLRRGAGASVLGRIGSAAMNDWKMFFGFTDVPSPRELVAGVEVVQGVADAAPVAISFTSAPKIGER